MKVYALDKYDPQLQFIHTKKREHVSEHDFLLAYWHACSCKKGLEKQ